MNEDYRANFGRKTPVLDDGFVCLVDVMGDEAAICQAARVCYGGGSLAPEKQRALIRDLIRWGHWSPFEMCEMKFYVRVPIYVWRQWIRHRTASVNEYSTRYGEAIDSAQTTEPDAWRVPKKNGATLDEKIGAELSESEYVFLRSARDLYRERLDAGVVREQARKDLPLSTYTEAYWKIDLRNLLHFIKLRWAPSAQKEIYEYANAIAMLVSFYFPNVWNAFLDYECDAQRFSNAELRALRGFLHYVGSPKVDENQMRDLCRTLDGKELDEAIVKFRELNLIAEEKGDKR